MTISAVIPVYNASRWLRQCLDSVLAQDYRGSYEIVLVDDGSTDGSSDICDEYAEAYHECIRVLHGPNEGQSAARNHGIAQAKGDYITFVDADDVLHKQAFSILSDMVESTGADIAASAPVQGQFRPLNTKIEICSGEEAALRYLYQKSNMAKGPWGQLIRKDLLTGDLLFAGGMIYEDLYLMPRLYAHVSTVAFTYAGIYLYRDTPGSTMNTWSARRLDVLTVTGLLEQAFADRPILLAAARDRNLAAAFNIYVLNMRHNADPEIAARCMDIIKERRTGTLMNGRVRTKNKLGALVSYLGAPVLNLLARL